MTLTTTRLVSGLAVWVAAMALGPVAIGAGPTGVPRVAAEVPAAYKSRGMLVAAADATYPPNEFIASDGETVVGMDPDLAKALGAVMGLRVKVGPRRSGRRRAAGARAYAPRTLREAARYARAALPRQRAQLWPPRTRKKRCEIPCAASSRANEAFCGRSLSSVPL
jgi:ABC-type amino acid transport substrate-binding protein